MEHFSRFTYAFLKDAALNTNDIYILENCVLFKQLTSIYELQQFFERILSYLHKQWYRSLVDREDQNEANFWASQSIIWHAYYERLTRYPYDLVKVFPDWPTENQQLFDNLHLNYLNGQTTPTQGIQKTTSQT